LKIKKQYKSVKEVINRGQFSVNVPVYIISIGIPVLSVFIISHFTPSVITVIVGILSFVLSFILAWTWWSFAISKWRLWAMKNTDKKDWVELNKKAIEGFLIWEEGHKFEKTEIRNNEEQKKIELFYKEINERKLLKNINDDLSIPPKIEYYFNRSELIAGIIINLLLILFGVYFSIYLNFIVGFIFTVWMIYSFDFELFRKLRSQKVQLQISNEGIEFDFTGLGLIKWSDTENILIEDPGNLTMGIWKDEIYYDVSYNLTELTTPKHEEFLRILNVYLSRDYKNNELKNSN